MENTIIFTIKKISDDKICIYRNNILYRECFSYEHLFFEMENITEFNNNVEPYYAVLFEVE